MNKQREVIYGFRNEIINSDDVRDRLMDIIEEVVVLKVEQFTAADTDVGEWKIRQLADWVNLNFPLGMPEGEIIKAAAIRQGKAGVRFAVRRLERGAICGLQFHLRQHPQGYELKISFEDPDKLATVERYTILSAIDKLWQEHLYEMDSLRHSIGLRAHGQRDPLMEYKAEAFKIFDELMVNVKTEICHNVFRSASSMMAFEEFLAQRSANRPGMSLRPALLRTRKSRLTETSQRRGEPGGGRGLERQNRNRRAPARKSAATTRVPAAAAKNTSNAVANNF